MNKTVTTISGKICDEGNCRLIDKQYYLIGDIFVENSGDVYLINGRYIRQNTGRIFYNYTKGQYELKSLYLNIVNGIVGIKEGEFLFGDFERNYLENIIVHDLKGNTLLGLNDDVLDLNYREKTSNGEFYHISKLSAKEFTKIEKVSREYKESLKYDSKDILAKHIDKYNKNYNPSINEYASELAKSLDGLSFGLEFETSLGVIPNNRITNLPMIPLRDGSIDGLEYVTIPLEGEKGVQAVIDCVKELKKRTKYDDSCSMHLHIGNIPRTPEFLLALYRMTSYFQEEMFAMFPLYKKYNFGVKRKNYSKPFDLFRINASMDPCININSKDSVNRNFAVLFDYLADGYTFEGFANSLEEVKFHPRDMNGNQKWNIKTRYHAVNFIPIIFGNKQTVEFRIHTPTYDINKILYFIAINAAIINFAKKNTQRILGNPRTLQGITLDSLMTSQMLNYQKPSKYHRENLLEDMHSYIHARKQYIAERNSYGDIRASEDGFNFYSSSDFNHKIMTKKYFIKSDLNLNNKINEEVVGGLGLGELSKTLRCKKPSDIESLKIELQENSTRRSQKVQNSHTTGIDVEESIRQELDQFIKEPVTYYVRTDDAPVLSAVQNIKFNHYSGIINGVNTDTFKLEVSPGNPFEKNADQEFEPFKEDSDSEF